MEVNDVEDIQLSQSTTDIGVHIELSDGDVELMPQEVSEADDDGAVRDISMTDAPVVPETVSTSMISHLDLKTNETVGENTDKITQAEKGPSKAKIAGTASGKVTTESQRMMDEIDGAKLLQDELIRRDPSLASISSFLNTVCGVTAPRKKTEGIEGANVRVTEDKERTAVISTKTRAEEKCLEKQRIKRILVAKTILEEELAKDEPSLFSAAAFRKAAYGGDVSEGEGPVCDVVGPEETAITAPTVHIILQPATTTSSTRLEEEQVMDTMGTSGDAITVMTDETEVVISDDAAMSIDRSDDEGGSDGFSRSESSSDRGGSTVSSVSRKRPADGSPDREARVTDRKGFPGTVTRSEGGCRIYVPTATGATSATIV